MIFMLYGVVALLFGIFSGMLIGGAAGLAAIFAHFPLGLDNIAALVNINAWGMSTSFTLTALPLFVFMGEIAARTGLVSKLFDSFLLLTKGKIPGGLLQPVILTSTVFAACSGASTASAAALGSIIYPDLKKQRYNPGLSAATLAAGGSLAMLIPPSIALIIFAALSDSSISSCYLGAVFPGIIIAFLFICYLAFRIPRPPKIVATSSAEADNLAMHVGPKQIIHAVLNLSAFLGLMLTVLAPLYLGIATGTEVAAMGSAGSILLAIIYKKFNFKILWDAALGAVIVMGLAYFIIFGSVTFTLALATTGVAAKLPLLVKAIGNPHITMTLIFLLYVIMGMTLDNLGILFIATPFTLPILTEIGFSVIWSGVFIVIMVEIACLTPPVGMNLFVLHGSTRVPFSDIAKGAIPFVLILVCVVVLIYFFPQIVDWLPSTTR